jgi:hypothetical protein
VLDAEATTILCELDPGTPDPTQPEAGRDRPAEPSRLTRRGGEPMNPNPNPNPNPMA